jgi:phosphoglycolate phosphatase
LKPKSPAPVGAPSQPVRALLFDLDGTLLDTAHDMTLALRRALADHQLPAPDVEQVRTMIGRGAPTLVARAAAALNLPLDDQAQALVLDAFFFHYGDIQERGETAAQPYPGVMEGLQRLHATGLPMAIVTNKQQRFAQTLLRMRAMDSWFGLVVGGDTCEKRKPDPMPLLFAAEQLGHEAKHTLMVGDSVNDVTAAHAAGMRVACLPYGYNEGQDPRQLPADFHINSITELPALLGLGDHGKHQTA